MGRMVDWLVYRDPAYANGPDISATGIKREPKNEPHSANRESDSKTEAAQTKNKLNVPSNE